MPGNLMTNTPPRDIGYNVVQALVGRLTLAGADGNVKIGTLPAGSVLLGIFSRVATAVTGGTPVLAIATTTSGSNIQGTLAEAAGSELVFPSAAVAQPFTADTDLYAVTSGGATAGDVVIVAIFVKPLT